MSDRVAALTIERLPLAALKPHPRNPRKHPAPGSPQWEALRASLGRDYFDPLVLNRTNGMLVSGHLRHKVLLDLDYTHADVSIVEYDEPTHLARLVAANQLLGEWETDILTSLAHDIEAAGLSPGLAGWDEDQLAAQLAGPSIEDDTQNAVVLVSKAEDLQREWQVQLGDLYQAGPHRILCGDCTRPESWRALLGDRVVDIVWTDPPYNVAYDDLQTRRIELKAQQGRLKHNKPHAILNDNLSDAAYERLLLAAFKAAFDFTKPGGTLYVAHAETQGLVNRTAVAANGWHLAQCLVWVKNVFTLGRQDYQWQHEPVLYGWKPGGPHYWQGGYNQTTVIDDEEKNLSKLDKSALVEIIQRLRNARDSTIIREPRNNGNDIHPTVKPLALVARQIWNSSRKGDVVAELFCGSGTTIVAAHQTGRTAVATELEPMFVAVILQRLKDAGLTIEKVDQIPQPPS